MKSKKLYRLPPEVNKILYIKNLPYTPPSSDPSYSTFASNLYSLFSQYGAIRQIRVSNSKDTKGTAFVVYDDIYDAKAALEALNGYNFMKRYLVVLYYQSGKFERKVDFGKVEGELSIK